MFPANTKDENVRNIKNTAQTVKNEATDAAHEIKGDLREAANKSGRKVRELFDNAKSEFSHASDTVSKQIHDRPVQSTLVALGAGFLIGLIARSGRR